MNVPSTSFCSFDEEHKERLHIFHKIISLKPDESQAVNDEMETAYEKTGRLSNAKMQLERKL